MNVTLHRPIVLEIIGSTRPGRIGHSIAEWFHEQASERTDVAFEVADLADWGLPFLDEPLPPMTGVYANEHTRRWSETVARADGFVIVTPEYNHGYPAALKNALDYLYREWANKPVAFVSYGMGGGKLSVAQLREVVDALGMHPLPEQVAVFFRSGMFDDRHRMIEPRAALADYAGQASALIESLARSVHAALTAGDPLAPATRSGDEPRAIRATRAEPSRVPRR